MPLSVRVLCSSSVVMVVSPLCLSQIYDNAMITAGLNDDPRPMISRLNDLLTRAMEKH